MIKIGNTSINKIYKGNENILAAYVGNNKIFGNDFIQIADLGNNIRVNQIIEKPNNIYVSYYGSNNLSGVSKINKSTYTVTDVMSSYVQDRYYSIKDCVDSNYILVGTRGNMNVYDDSTNSILSGSSFYNDANILCSYNNYIFRIMGYNSGTGTYVIRKPVDGNADLTLKIEDFYTRAAYCRKNKLFLFNSSGQCKVYNMNLQLLGTSNLPSSVISNFNSFLYYQDNVTVWPKNNEISDEALTNDDDYLYLNYSKTSSTSSYNYIARLNLSDYQFSNVTFSPSNYSYINCGGLCMFTNKYGTKLVGSNDGFGIRYYDLNNGVLSNQKNVSIPRGSYWNQDTMIACKNNLYVYAAYGRYIYKYCYI